MEKREGRYKQYERSRNPVPFRIQEKDVELLRALVEYRFLDLDQIEILLPRQLTTTNLKNRKRTWQRRLHYLFHNSLVTRPPRQRDYLSPQKPTVYGLGNKGAELLAQRDGIDRDEVNWQQRNREVGLAHIDHTLMIGRMRATLTLATQNTEEVNLYHWESELLAT